MLGNRVPQVTDRWQKCYFIINITYSEIIKLIITVKYCQVSRRNFNLCFVSNDF